MFRPMHWFCRRLLTSSGQFWSAVETVRCRNVSVYTSGAFRNNVQTSTCDHSDRRNTRTSNSRCAGAWLGNMCLQRNFTTTFTASNSNRINDAHLLETWCYEVDPFGKLDVNIPFTVIIDCLNPQKYPEMNRAFVKLHYETSGQDQSPGAQAKDRLEYLQELYQFSTTLSDEKAVLSVVGSLPKGVVIPLLCHIQIPVKFGIQVQCDGEADVMVQNVGSDRISIIQCQGNTVLHNVQCGQIRVCNNDGHITSQQLLQGDIQLQAGGSGSITADRLQGSSISCGVERGGMDIKSVYATESHFASTASNIHIRSCHGLSNIQLGLGQLSIDTLDGDLTATVEQGSVDVYASRHNNIDIKVTKGNIKLRLPETASTMVEVHSETFACDDLLQARPLEGGQGKKAFSVGGGEEGGQSGSVTLAADEGVTLLAQDWFSTLKLQSD